MMMATRPTGKASVETDDWEETVCAVCGDGRSEEEDKIVFCDQCDLAVHQMCYGVSSIPAGKWFCRLCENGVDCRKISCAICGHKGGAFKPTTQGSWAHIHCGIWIPEVGFTHPDRLEKIDITNLNPARKNLKCYICQQKKAGPCVQCPVGKCHISFHPWCLLYKGHPDVYVPPGEYEAYCKKHSPSVEYRKPQILLKVQEFNESPKARGGVRGRGGGRGGRGGNRRSGQNNQCGSNNRGAGRLMAARGGVDKDSSAGDEAASFNGQEGPHHHHSSNEPGSHHSPRDSGSLIPCFSEYPGQHINEQLDLDHFWSAVNMYFPEEQPKEFLEMIRASILPASAQTTEEGRVLEDRIFRLPRLKSSSCQQTTETSADSFDPNGNAWGMESLDDDDDDGNWSDASFEADEDLPADALLNLLKKERRLRQEHGSPTGGLNSREKLTTTGSKISVFFSGQTKQFSCNYTKRHSAGKPTNGDHLAPVDLELIDLEQGEQQQCQKHNHHHHHTLDVNIVQPSQIELDLMSHQQEFRLTTSVLEKRVEGMMERIYQEWKKKEEQSKETVEAEQRYLKAKVWKTIALGLGRGLQDQKPDFNKRHEEVLPASWTVPVDGRPPPPPPEAVDPPEEDDAICMVCFDGTSTETNQIVFCDGCDVAVHQACYGLAEVPEGDFFCEKCAGLMEDPNRAIVCALCPEIHGGFKRTVDGHWVHLVCAMLCPESRLVNVLEMGPVDLSSSPVTYSASPVKAAAPPRLAPSPTADTGFREEGKESAAAKAQDSEGGVGEAIVLAEATDEMTPPPDAAVAAATAAAALVIGSTLSSSAQDAGSAPASPSKSIGRSSPRSTTSRKSPARSEEPDISSAHKSATRSNDDAMNPSSPSINREEGPTVDLSKSEEKSVVTSAASPGTRKPGECVICNSNRGYTFRCSHDSCEAHFHLLCAWFRGAYVSMKVVDRSFRGRGEDETYPAGLEIEVYCLEHCPPGKRDRIEQIKIRAHYRLREDEVKRNHRKKSSNSYFTGEMRGIGMNQRQELVPDLYKNYACSICLAPSAPLLDRNRIASENKEEEAQISEDPQKMDDDHDTGEEEKKENEKTSIPEPVVACTRCGISVHVSCYSDFHGPPPSFWKCETCSGPGESCVLCPRRGGLMVPTNDRSIRWVHAFCSQHNGPVVFKSGRSPVLPYLTAVDVHGISKDAKKMKCTICGRKGGLCMKCSAPGCNVQFHVLCAKLDGWYFDTCPVGEVPVVWCPGHLPDGVYRGFNGQHFDMKATHRLRKNLDRARLIVDLVRKREKMKKTLWRAECDVSEDRLRKLRVLLEGRAVELNNGKRLTDDRLTAYRQDIEVLSKRPSSPPPPPLTAEGSRGSKPDLSGLIPASNRSSRGGATMGSELVGEGTLDIAGAGSEIANASLAAVVAAAFKEKRALNDSTDSVGKGDLLISERFEEFAEENRAIAAQVLGREGRIWTSAGKRLSRADFEKTLNLLVDPECLRRREKRLRLASGGNSSAKMEARVSLDKKLLELITCLEDCKDNDGRSVSSTFDVVPDVEAYPEYYECVQYPIDLETMRHRVQTFFYQSMSEFVKDFQQLIRNAKKYNAPRSQAHVDADLLKNVFETRKAEILEKEKAAAIAASGGSKWKRRRLGSSGASSDEASVYQEEKTTAESKFSVKKRIRKRKGRSRRSSKEHVCCACSLPAISKGQKEEDDGADVKELCERKAGSGLVQGYVHFCQDCSFRLADRFLGRRVEVLWPDDNFWYSGLIYDFEPSSGQHRIWYDDGEWEFVHLTEQEICFLDPIQICEENMDEGEEPTSQFDALSPSLSKEHITSQEEEMTEIEEESHGRESSMSIISSSPVSGNLEIISEKQEPEEGE